MYKGVTLKVAVCVTTAFQPEGSTVSFVMSGDRGSLFSVVSDVRVTVQVAFIQIPTKTCAAVVHLVDVGSFYCAGSGESHVLCMVSGYAEVTMWGETMVENLSISEWRHCAAHCAVVEATWDTPSHKHPSRLVVVQALAGLLEVAVAFVYRGESCLSQVLPVEGAAAQLLALGLGPGPLDSQQMDVAG